MKFASAEQPRVTVRATLLDGARDIRLDVVDNGMGIDPQDRPRLFQPFARLPSAAGQPGTGLGLAIAQRVIERNAGSIGVDSDDRRRHPLLVHPAGGLARRAAARSAGGVAGGGEVALDRAGGGEQRRQQRRVDVGDVGARRLGGDVDRGDDVAVAVVDRRGDRAQAGFELLVDERPALARGPCPARRAARRSSAIVSGVRAAGRTGAIDVGEVGSGSSPASSTRPIDVA